MNGPWRKPRPGLLFGCVFTLGVEFCGFGDGFFTDQAITICNPQIDEVAVFVCHQVFARRNNKGTICNVYIFLTLQISSAPTLEENNVITVIRSIISKCFNFCRSFVGIAVGVKRFYVISEDLLLKSFQIGNRLIGCRAGSKGERKG